MHTEMHMHIHYVFVFSSLVVVVVDVVVVSSLFSASAFACTALASSAARIFHSFPFMSSTRLYRSRYAMSWSPPPLNLDTSSLVTCVHLSSSNFHQLLLYFSGVPCRT